MPPPEPVALAADLSPEALRNRRRDLTIRHAQVLCFYADFRTGEVSCDSSDEPLAPMTQFEDLLAQVHADHHDDFLTAWAVHLATGAPATLEAVTRGRDGVFGWSSFAMEAIRDGAGPAVGIVCSRQDIEERRAIELELLEQTRQAEAASRAKGEFLANMSHEIRTPLNGILTMAQVMAHGELSGEQRNLLSIVRQSGQDLLHVLNDILDFSKIEAGRMELEETEFDPEAVLESALAGFAALAEKKDLQLWLDVAASARGMRRGDPGRLRQIIANFVSNALKFTERGGVRIAIEGTGPNGREGLHVSVKDTGPGVAPEKMPQLFQKFTQMHASTTRRFGGTGLGLAICRELATLMGGHVWAESVVGEGSSFHASLSLPYLRDIVVEVGGGGEMEDLGQAGRPLRLLAAEDNPTNRAVLSTVMQVFGFDLTLVNDGSQAVEAWSGQRFDAILMDVQMPVMDGVQATRAIRAAEAATGRERTPIIALSANAFHHQIGEYLSAGMDTHVAKPIELSALQAALEYVLSTPEPEALAQAG